MVNLWPIDVFILAAYQACLRHAQRTLIKRHFKSTFSLSLFYVSFVLASITPPAPFAERRIRFCEFITQTYLKINNDLTVVVLVATLATRSSEAIAPCFIGFSSVWLLSRPVRN
jgi:hypothetical protein